MSGEVRGHDAIRDWAGRRVFELAEGDFKAAPTEMAAVNESTVLVRFGVKAHRADASIDSFALQRVVLENGKCASVHNVHADQYEFDAFFKIRGRPLGTKANTLDGYGWSMVSTFRSVPLIAALDESHWEGSNRTREVIGAAMSHGAK